MSSIRVLVVDDNSILNFACCEMLREGGFDAIGVHCADTAFETIDRDTNLSAVVTDIDLGAGPDGFDVARRARGANPDLPLVFISGTTAARQRAEHFEGSEFLGKPFALPQLMEALHRVLPRKEGAEGTMKEVHDNASRSTQRC